MTSTRSTPMLVAPLLPPAPSAACRGRPAPDRRAPLALGAVVGLAVERRLALRCQPSLRERAEQIAKDRAALRIGPGGIESVVGEVERQQLAQEADTLSPFRRGVIFAAILLLFGGLQDGPGRLEV